MRLEEAIRDFLSFLRRPKYDQQWAQALSWITITKLFILVFCIEMLALTSISGVVGLDEIPHALESVMDNSSLWAIAALAIILAPFFEELLFRYHLKYKWLSILFLFVLGCGVLWLLLKAFAPDIEQQLMQNAALITENWFLLSVTVAVFVVIITIVFMVSQAVPLTFISQTFPFIFYATALAFALVHIGNFNTSTVAWYMTPLLVLPQFILALYLGYIRMRKNIWSSIYVHSLNNSIPILLYALVDLGGK